MSEQALLRPLDSGHARHGYSPQFMPTEPPALRATPYDTPQIVALRSQQDVLGSTHTMDRTQRRELRQRVADQLYGNGAPRKERKVWLVMGPPAAGKSSALVAPLAREHGALVIDADMAKTYLPEFNGGHHAGRVHLESDMIASRVIEKAVLNGDNIVLAVVGKGLPTLERYRDLFHQAGYGVHLRLVHLPPEKAAARAVERFQQTGRFVDPAYVLYDVGLRPLENYRILTAEGGFESYEAYSNDVPKGQAPVRIYPEGESEGGGDG